MITVVVAVDLMTVLVAVQKGLTVEKLLHRQHNNHLELPTGQIIIHLVQGRVS